MDDTAALSVAIKLIHIPARVRLVKTKSLPEDVSLLLRIAADEQDAVNAAMAQTGHSQETIRKASIFFIEQILFCSDADSYRILGARSKANYAELRRNMALLLRWLHPDRNDNPERILQVHKVTRAWEDLKTQNRRSSYDTVKNVMRENRKNDSRQTCQKKKHNKLKVTKPQTIRNNKNQRHHLRPVRIYQTRRKSLLFKALSLLFKNRIS